MGKTLKQLYELANDGEPNNFSAMSSKLFYPNMFPQVLHHPQYQGELSTIINEFMRRFSNMETLYDTVEEFQAAFNSWTRGRSYVWDRLYQTLSYKYDPIYNYDRYETTEETRSSRHSEEGSSKSKQSSSMKSSGSDERNTLNKVYAYNVDDPADKDSETVEIRNIGNGSGSTQSDDSGSSRGESDEKYTRTVRAYGNIGVTTSQQMIASEREVSMFNMVDHVCEEFKAEFLIMVY